MIALQINIYDYLFFWPIAGLTMTHGYQKVAYNQVDTTVCLSCFRLVPKTVEIKSIFINTA